MNCGSVTLLPPYFAFWGMEGRPAHAPVKDAGGEAPL